MHFDLQNLPPSTFMYRASLSNIARELSLPRHLPFLDGKTSSILFQSHDEFPTFDFLLSPVKLWTPTPDRDLCLTALFPLNNKQDVS